MTILSDRLPSGNMYFWFGTGKGWGESGSGIDNALILTGGDVLLLKTIESISLHDAEVMNDLKKLDYNEFCKKYSLENLNDDLWKEIKYGLETGKYPIISDRGQQYSDYVTMIQKYVAHLDIEQLENVRSYIDRRIAEIRKKRK